MKKIVICIIASLTLSIPVASADQDFSDQAAWESGLTGADQFGTDYSSLDGFGVLQPVEDPIIQAWGDITVVDSGNPPTSGQTNTNVGFSGGVAVGLVFPSNECLTLNVDPAAGELEGFSFGYQVFAPGATVTIYDAANSVINTYALSDAIPAGPEGNFFGWINCNGDDVSRVEICSPIAFNSFIGGSFSFNPVVVLPGNQGALQLIIEDLENVLPLASAGDQFWIEAAIQDLTDAQDPVFWANDDRLSNFGTGFFNHVFWAVFALENVEDESLVQDLQESIQELLGAVVDAEISFAIETGGNQNLINFADFFTNFADAFAAAGLYLEAVLLNFYAWILAFFA